MKLYTRMSTSYRNDSLIAECGGIINSLPDGVFATDLDKRLTYFNVPAEKITGYKAEEVLGQYCYKIFKTNVCTTSCPLERSMRSGLQIIGFLAISVTKWGIETPISISCSCLKNHEGQIIGSAGTFRDRSIFSVLPIDNLKKEFFAECTFEQIVSHHPSMQKIFKILPDISKSEASVLIEGPTGTGKELVARAVHNLSSRKSRPLIPINCGALPESLLESELFGYNKGAFTDAREDKPGRLLLANNGSLLLDEVEEMSSTLQTKLLRFLEEKECIPLGGTEPKKVNFRLITTSNQSLMDLVTKGEFRRDLYYRLNVVKLKLPPLNERISDIPLLIEHFIREFNLLRGTKKAGFSRDAINLLMHYDFPGNIRELKNIVEYSCILSNGEIINLNDLPFETVNAVERVHADKSNLENGREVKLIDNEETEKIMQVIADHKRNRADAAKALGISRTTLWRRLRKYDLGA